MIRHYAVRLSHYAITPLLLAARHAAAEDAADIIIAAAIDMMRYAILLFSPFAAADIAMLYMPCHYFSRHYCHGIVVTASLRRQRQHTHAAMLFFASRAMLLPFRCYYYADIDALLLLYAAIDDAACYYCVCRCYALRILLRLPLMPR